MKKSYLLEIIREEIAAILNELTVVDKKTLPTEAPEIAKSENTDINTVKDAIAQAKKSGKPVNVAEDQLNEDLLMEGPFIEGPLDFAYIDGKVEKGILGKAVADATKAIEKSFPNINPESATQIITGKKARTSEKTPDAVKTALLKVDDAIQAQLDTFEDEKLLKDLLNKKEIGNSAEEIKRINSYIEPDDKGNVKRYVEKLGGPQTLNAVEKLLSGEGSTDVEPATVEKPKAEPKAAEKAPEAPKAEPKTAPAKPEKEKPEEKAAKSAQANKGLDKKADKKDQLLKDKKTAEDRMRELAQLIRTAEGDERASLMKDLKQVNADKLNIEKEIDKLF
jgi:hypothetical protein